MVHCSCCILFLSLVTTVITYSENIVHNYTLYRLVALTKKDRQLLYVIHKSYKYSNFLNGITNEAAIPMHIAVKDEYLEVFEDLLNQTDALYTKYQHFNYVPRPWREELKDLTDDSIVYGQFLSYPTILKLYQYWETKYPNTFQRMVIGKTHESHDIIVLKVSVLATKQPGTPAVFFLGGEEGRDWVSPAVLLIYIKSLLEETFTWATGFEAYFLPVFNPDGYAYSMYKDRFWAKNRKILEPKIMCRPPDIARGVNVDRNWMYRSKGERACDKMYFGHYISEYETYNLSEFLDIIAPQTLAFFNLKGFDNLITTPFARRNIKQDNLATIKEILRHTSQELDATFNKSYYYGITASLLFNYTGNCADWVKISLNVPVVITFYMKHEDNVIPTRSDIGPLSQQFATGVNEILSITLDLYGPLFKSQSRLMYNISFLIICIIFCIYMSDCARYYDSFGLK